MTSNVAFVRSSHVEASVGVINHHNQEQIIKGRIILVSRLRPYTPIMVQKGQQLEVGAGSCLIPCHSHIGKRGGRRERVRGRGRGREGQEGGNREKDMDRERSGSGKGYTPSKPTSNDVPFPATSL